MDLRMSWLEMWPLVRLANAGKQLPGCLRSSGRCSLADRVSFNTVIRSCRGLGEGLGGSWSWAWALATLGAVPSGPVTGRCLVQLCPPCLQRTQCQQGLEDGNHATARLGAGAFAARRCPLVGSGQLASTLGVLVDGAVFVGEAGQDPE